MPIKGRRTRNVLPVADAAKPVILHVSHSCGGGTEKHVRDLCRHFRQKAEMFILRDAVDDGVRVERADSGEQLEFDCTLDNGLEELVRLLKRLGVTRIHIHQLFALPISVRQLVRSIRVPFDLTIHDYYILCPHVHFKTKSNKYCGETGASQCASCFGSGPSHGKYQTKWLKSHDCLSAEPAPGAPDIVRWRESHKWAIEEADRVICPSIDTACRLQRYSESARLVVAPHDALDGTKIAPVSPRTIEPGQPMIVALLGSMEPFKGAAKVAQTARLVAERGLPIEFHILGSAGPESPLSPEAQVFQTGPYEFGDARRLIADISPHLIWFPAQVPETYSYTLSEAMEEGTPLVVPDLGAFPERVAGRPWSWVVPWDETPESVIELFLRIRDENLLTKKPPVSVPVAQRENVGIKIIRDFYERDYI